MKNIKALGFVLTMLLAQPAWAASDQLIYGMSNDLVLLMVLGSGVIILFACILTLAYMLYQSIPAIVQKRVEEAQKANSKS